MTADEINRRRRLGFIVLTIPRQIRSNALSRRSFGSGSASLVSAEMEYHRFGSRVSHGKLSVLSGQLLTIPSIPTSNESRCLRHETVPLVKSFLLSQPEILHLFVNRKELIVPQ